MVGREKTEFLGHFARSNRQVEAIRKEPRALIVFNGPNGYVSPSWMRDRTQAPTWNYATCHFTVEVKLEDNLEAAQRAVRCLVERMDLGRTKAWQEDELGERYAHLIKHIIAFRAKVVDSLIKFKLGQNERPDVFEDIVQGMTADGMVDLVAIMLKLRHDGDRTS
jgi:transcriptional regulator